MDLKKYQPGKCGGFALWFGQIIFFLVSLLKNDRVGEKKKKGLASFNTACGVLISRAFLGL